MASLQGNDFDDIKFVSLISLFTIQFIHTFCMISISTIFTENDVVLENISTSHSYH